MGLAVHLIKISVLEDLDVVDTFLHKFNSFWMALIMCHFMYNAKFVEKIIALHWMGFTEWIIHIREGIHRLG